MEHVVENAGSEKLYCLTVMVPNEGFAEMIRNGADMSLDAGDRTVIHGGQWERLVRGNRGSSRTRPARRLVGSAAIPSAAAGHP